MATLTDLTEREMQILQFVLAGRTNKAIAASMYISEKTVEFYLHRIYTKIAECGHAQWQESGQFNTVWDQ